MDILQPQLLWIGKRCYRVNDLANKDFTNQNPRTNEYIEDDLYMDEDGGENMEHEYEIQEIEPNKFKTSFHIPSEFFGRIIGTKGVTKNRIQGETKTEIIIPKPGKKDDIIILGKTRDSVCESRRRIELIATTSRNKERRTHFIGVKVLMDETFQKNYKHFKETVLQDQQINGINEELFTPIEKLHITLTVMALMDDVDRTQAINLLNKCCDEIVLPIKKKFGGIRINVRGLEIMNDDPSMVKILYGKIESDALQQIADQIYAQFIRSGLSKREFDRDNVKLHATLITTKYAEDDANKRKLRFDARKILEQFSDYEFGSFEMNDIHLAICKSKDEDGYYKLTTNIKI